MKIIFLALVLLAMSNSVFAQAGMMGNPSKHQKEENFIILDQGPEFPGGLDSLSAFMGNNLIYPQSARRDAIEGKVLITFVIDKDGKVIDPEIVESVRADIDQSAIDLVRMMPDWKPAFHEGEFVRVRQRLPINFRLTE